MVRRKTRHPTRNIITENRQEHRKASGCDREPCAIKSWLAMSKGLNGFKMLIKLDGHVVGGGYRTGARNIPKVSAIPSILPISLKTRLMIDKTKLKPIASKMTGNNMNGTKTICALSGTPYQIKTNVKSTSLIIKSKRGCPIAAITRASFGKFTLLTKDPALTKLFVQTLRQPAKSCQTLMLQRA
jgi:hypothetical protein